MLWAGMIQARLCPGARTLLESKRGIWGSWDLGELLGVPSLSPSIFPSPQAAWGALPPSRAPKGAVAVGGTHLALKK